MADSATLAGRRNGHEPDRRVARTPAPTQCGTDDLALSFGDETLAMAKSLLPVGHSVRPAQFDGHRMRGAKIGFDHRTQRHAIGLGRRTRSHRSSPVREGLHVGWIHSHAPAAKWVSMQFRQEELKKISALRFPCCAPICNEDICHAMAHPIFRISVRRQCDAPIQARCRPDAAVPSLAAAWSQAPDASVRSRATGRAIQWAG